MSHRSAVLAGGFAVVLLTTAALTLRVDLGDMPTASANKEGMVLSAANLAPTDRIVFDYESSGCRSYHHWSLVLFGGPERRLAVIDAGGSYGVEETYNQKPRPIGALSLSSKDCKGLDAMLEAYRHPADRFFGTTTIRLRVSYFRGEQRIGAEEFVDNGMIEYWVSARGEAGTTPADSWITPETVSLRQLHQRAAESEHSFDWPTEL